MWKRPISKAVSPQTLQQCPVTLILQPPPNPKPPRKNYKTPKARRTVMEAAGFDSDGREFKNAQEMWREQIGDADEGDNHKKTQWYREGVAYWEGVEASVDGVLGGFGQVNEADVKGSEVFLNTLLHERFDGGGRNQHLVALDCGSGIGRITKNLLIRYFNEVDLLEPVSHFLDAARESLSQEYFVSSDAHKATNFYCVSLQEFTPDAGRYNVIWIQWCIGHLTDDDFVSFFKRAKDQKGLPEELFAVKMYALTTEGPNKVLKTRSKAQANRPGIIK
ncbi:PREDICTED: alpha N-terminal protein methyltransferase 1 isoform X2 [Theobroma cacao]|uniref:Alpha N-terminal protein methyltransferase 1 n=1 Tax=Theobroma cacao TaxID=3641 RepID=A0AB32WHZ8_THECC|nr:PREDICTED: alpha N-terminal protein methyltransferase 1 isoform X2 [Theobroma cacao]